MGVLPVRSFTRNRWLEDGDEVTVGDLTLQVRHCPGHTGARRILTPRLAVGPGLHSSQGKIKGFG